MTNAAKPTSLLCQHESALLTQQAETIQSLMDERDQLRASVERLLVQRDEARAELKESTLQSGRLSNKIHHHRVRAASLEEENRALRAEVNNYKSRSNHVRQQEKAAHRKAVFADAWLDRRFRNLRPGAVVDAVVCGATHRGRVVLLEIELSERSRRQRVSVRTESGRLLVVRPKDVKLVKE